MQFLFSIKSFQFDAHTIDLVIPDSKAVQELYAKGEISFPYWSKVWPAAIALSQFIAAHPHYVQNKKVLELAAGLGLPSVIASKHAASVLCTDHQPVALEFVHASAKHNNATNISVAVLDWNDLSSNIEADVLLLSDVNYDPANFADLKIALQRFLLQGTTIILSTPQRLMSKPFIEDLLSFCIYQEEIFVQEDGDPVAISILILQGTNQPLP